MSHVTGSQRWALPGVPHGGQDTRATAGTPYLLAHTSALNCNQYPGKQFNSNQPCHHHSHKTGRYGHGTGSVCGGPKLSISCSSDYQVAATTALSQPLGPTSQPWACESPYCHPLWQCLFCGDQCYCPLSSKASDECHLPHTCCSHHLLTGKHKL